MRTVLQPEPAEALKAEGPMAISVLVPTFRRQSDLARCLEALAAQERLADEIIIVARESDKATLDYLSSLNGISAICVVTISETGVVAAMNLGLKVASGDIVALTDDDAAPRADWLKLIEARFKEDPRIAGVGGRDIIRGESAASEIETHTVGVLQWSGRTIGAHHRGIGEARVVDFLKGVNCAYQRNLLSQIGFETRLLGSGAQVHWEISIGLALRKKGYWLIYDPAIRVDHYPAARHDADKRTNMEGVVLYNAVYNEALAIWQYLPPIRRVAYFLWGTFIGTKLAPGLLTAVLLFRRDKMRSIKSCLTSLRARYSVIF